MRLIVKMVGLNKKQIDPNAFKNLTTKQKKHIAISNQLKTDGYKILPVSAEEFKNRY